MDQYIGRLLDNRYEILEIIGTGGMAVVYKARCHRLNRLVAIKILKDEFSRDEEFRRRFKAEGEAVAMLSHPNIVQVYDVSSSENADFIVMELVDGISLKQYMEKKGVLNWKETLHFAMQIAKGLEHAHSRGIVHRDIKPHNVMVLKNGSVKVMDFGIARVMSKTNTLTKEALGSVHYISPEQAKGGWVDNRSDLYSLSVVMYEMMSGRPPYDGESPVAVAIQHINGGAPMPSTLNPNIPGGLEQIIMKGMALDTKDRYASATEMLRDMEEFRKNPMILFAFAPARGVSDATQPIGMSSISGSIAQTTAERTARRRTEGNLSRTAAAAGAGAAGAMRQRKDTGARASQSRSSGNAARRNRQELEAEEKKSRMTTIAIVACSGVAVIAIIIFLIALLSGALFHSDMVKVPDLLGETYYSGMTHDGLIIKAEHTYNPDYPKGTIFDQNPASGSEVAQGAVIKVTVSMGAEPEVKLMEDLVGQTAEDASSFLVAQGMNPLPKEEFNDDVEAGRVIRTDPEEGTALNDGQTVYLYISKGPMIEKAKVPNVMGKSFDNAVDMLGVAGFDHVTPKYVDSDEPKDTVLEQSVEAGTELDVTETIILTVSKGPTMAEVPDVIGESYLDGRYMLTIAGFGKVTPEYVESDEPKDTIIDQSVEGGTELDIREEIVLTVSKGPVETTPPTEDPDETEPDTEPQEVTKVVSFALPDREEVYVLSIYHEGAEIRESTQIMPGTTSLNVELTGSGVQYYDLYINGEFYQTVEVPFS